MVAHLRLGANIVDSTMFFAGLKDRCRTHILLHHSGTPRRLWGIRKAQRLQAHAQPDGQPTSAAPSSSRLQLATNSKATDIIFWACRCGSWGSCGPQRCTYKVRTCICVMSGLIPDMQVVQMKPVRLNRLIQLTSSLGPVLENNTASRIASRYNRAIQSRPICQLPVPVCVLCCYLFISLVITIQNHQHNKSSLS